MPLLESLLARAADRKGILKDERQYQFPVILRSGINDKGKNVHYVFNYSYEPVRVNYLYGKGVSLTDGRSVSKGQELTIGPWDVSIVVEK